jgi:hypothetical protein
MDRKILFDILASRAQEYPPQKRDELFQGFSEYNQNKKVRRLAAVCSKHFDEGLRWFGITFPISMQRCQEPFLKDLPRKSFSP